MFYLWVFLYYLIFKAMWMHFTSFKIFKKRREIWSSVLEWGILLNATVLIKLQQCYIYNNPEHGACITHEIYHLSSLITRSHSAFIFKIFWFIKLNSTPAYAEVEADFKKRSDNLPAPSEAAARKQWWRDFLWSVTTWAATAAWKPHCFGSWFHNAPPMAKTSERILDQTHELSAKNINTSEEELKGEENPPVSPDIPPHYGLLHRPKSFSIP